MLKQDKRMKNIPIWLAPEKRATLKRTNAPAMLKGSDFNHNREDDSFNPTNR